MPMAPPPPPPPLSSFFFLTILSLILTAAVVSATTNPDDAAAMHVLAKSIGADSSLNWSPTSDPCTQWPKVHCDPSDGKVTSIQIGNIANLSGSIPPNNILRNLTSLVRFEAMSVGLSGPLPTFHGPTIRYIYLHDNRFTSIPAHDFFSGLTALSEVTLDHNPFAPWQIPSSITDCSALVSFSANNASITGGLSDVFATSFPALEHLGLGSNDLRGEIPASFADNTGLKSLWLGGANLSGGIAVIANMTGLNEVLLNFNSLMGPLPDFSRMVNLQTLRLRDNRLTGPVPSSLTGLKSLTTVTLSNNLLQGHTPVFGKNVKSLDLDPDKESFCHGTSDRCDPRVEALLSIVGSFGYPIVFAQNWEGNDPCASWLGISCDGNGSISVVNFQKMNLSGSISPDFESLALLQKIILSSNSLIGTIPLGLANLKLLKVLDVSNNALSGKIPSFRSDVTVITNGNPDIGKDISPPPGGSSSTPPDDSGGGVNLKKSNAGVIAGSIIAVFVVIGVVGLLGFLYWKKRRDSEFVKIPIPRPGTMFHPRHSWSDVDLLKNSVTTNWSGTLISNSGGGTPANMAITIEVLREVTYNFSEDNVLGRGGFGTVYRGELRDGTMIAVKRMESGVIESKGLEEFKSEISVLTKVRHRHLVSLLGYCLDRNERMLVYEYMPQGTLSDHLFGWAKAGLQPLQWKIRLIIALDVARGVEYLHSLMNQSFIHRDLKPSNILLTNDMRAKVADFGLVRLAPEGKHCSIETRIAGTFGYLAPEYAVTGRVTTKADIYSFGVILLELITGRKALDNSLPEDHSHLITWFRRMQLNEETRSKAFDPSIDLNDEEIRDSVRKVSELAGHCTARDPHQRPDMSYVVSTLSSLAEHWQPSDQNSEDGYGIDINMILPEGLQNWQAINTSQILNYSDNGNNNNNNNTESSIPPNTNTLTCR